MRTGRTRPKKPSQRRGILVAVTLSERMVEELDAYAKAREQQTAIRMTRQDAVREVVAAWALARHGDRS